VYAAASQSLQVEVLQQCLLSGELTCALHAMCLFAQASGSCARAQHTGQAALRGADELFRNTGLERSAALEQDIAWMQQEFGLAPVSLSDDGPGRSYARCFVMLPVEPGLLLSALPGNCAWGSMCTAWTAPC